MPDNPVPPLSGIIGGAAREPSRGRRAAEVADLVRLQLGLPDAAVTVSSSPAGSPAARPSRP